MGSHVVFNRTDNFADDPGVVNSGSNDGRFNETIICHRHAGNHYETLTVL